MYSLLYHEVQLLIYTQPQGRSQMNLDSNSEKNKSICRVKIKTKFKMPARYSSLLSFRFRTWRNSWSNRAAPSIHPILVDAFFWESEVKTRWWLGKWWAGLWTSLRQGINYNWLCQLSIYTQPQGRSQMNSVGFEEKRKKQKIFCEYLL